MESDANELLVDISTKIHNVQMGIFRHNDSYKRIKKLNKIVRRVIQTKEIN